MKLDKLLHSRWFVKIVALFLALMLYAAVNMDEPSSPSPSTGIMSSSSQENDALSNVPLVAYYDEENYSISNIPTEVNVYLEGSTSQITTARMQQDFEVFVDLRELEPGTHSVQVQHEGFSNKLAVKIDPEVVSVNIQEKVSKTMAVEIEYLNKDQIAEGYSTEQSIILPDTVQVTGAKEDVETIGFVKGFLDLNGVSKTVEKSVPLKVYDRKGELLDLEIEPSVVDVKVPIIAPNKTVPIMINRTGTIQDGLSIQSFDVTPNEITIFGPKEVLKDIEFIDNIQFDVSKLTDDVTQELEVPVPDGINRVSPEKVSIQIDVEPEEKQELTNIPIKVIGIADSMEATFQSPSLGVVDLKVYGAKSVVENINRNDFHVVLNVSEYSLGEHEVDLEVFGPRDIRWELSVSEAVIVIKEKE